MDDHFSDDNYSSEFESAEAVASPPKERRSGAPRRTVAAPRADSDADDGDDGELSAQQVSSFARNSRQERPLPTDALALQGEVRAANRRAERFRQQLQTALRGDRFVALQAQVRDLEGRVKDLTAENRTLRRIQNSQEKALAQSEAVDVPRILRGVEDEQRMLKEQVQKYRTKNVQDQSEIRQLVQKNIKITEAYRHLRQLVEENAPNLLPSSASAPTSIASARAPTGARTVRDVKQLTAEIEKLRAENKALHDRLQMRERLPMITKRGAAAANGARARRPGIPSGSASADGGLRARPEVARRIKKKPGRSGDAQFDDDDDDVDAGDDDLFASGEFGSAAAHAPSAAAAAAVGGRGGKLAPPPREEPYHPESRRAQQAKPLARRESDAGNVRDVVDSEPRSPTGYVTMNSKVGVKPDFVGKAKKPWQESAASATPSSSSGANLPEVTELSAPPSHGSAESSPRIHL